MGDRVSISFIKDKEESVILFSHWGGMSLVAKALAYVRELDEEVPEGRSFPLSRREPNTVLVDFLRVLLADEERILGDYYLASSQSLGDNSDNGHHSIPLGSN